MTEKVAMTEVLKTHQNLLVKCVRDSEQTTLYTTSRKESNVMIGMFPNVQNSKLQVDADSETSVRTHTAKIAYEKKNAATVAIHITASDEQHTEVQRQKCRMTRLNSESGSIISRTVVFKKGRIGTCTWSHPDSIQKSEKTKRCNIR